MCGICGCVLSDPAGAADRGALKRMCAAIRHRGPDEAGIFVLPGMGFGHQRLKIIDLVSGQQPMTDEGEHHALVFNGEIYNYRELRSSLEVEGCVFRTHSDTEILFQGLVRHGLDFVPRLNGMFAFAFWDTTKKEVLLVRDRFGIKPLYWSLRPGLGLIFASEASALRASGLLPCEVAPESLAFFLGLSYIPGERSIYRGVNRLQPGSWLRYSAASGVTEGKWWNLASEWKKGLRTAATGRDWEEEFFDLLSDAVKIRMQSDVPLGAFLSSGVDSSTIVALMKRHSPATSAFTMSFHDASHDESVLAAETARLLGVTHYVESAELNATEVLIELARQLDEPFADTSIIPMYTLCENARKHVTVALTGDGADELLGGYVTLQADALYAKLRLLPASLLALFHKAVETLPETHKRLDLAYKLKQFFRAFPRPAEEAHASWRMLFQPEVLAGICSRGEVAREIFSPFLTAWNEAQGLPQLDRFLYVDYKTWLADDILVKADRASMLHALELRSPFLDWRLFRLCAGMPPALKRHGRDGKILLKRLARRLLPPRVLARPKQGFNAPVARWLATQWRPLAEEYLRPARLEAVGLNPRIIGTLWREHRSGKRNHGFRLFPLLMYLLWSETAGSKQGRPESDE